MNLHNCDSRANGKAISEQFVEFIDLTDQDLEEVRLPDGGGIQGSHGGWGWGDGGWGGGGWGGSCGFSCGSCGFSCGSCGWWHHHHWGWDQ